MKTVKRENDPVMKATIHGSPANILCFASDVGKFMDRWINDMTEAQGPMPEDVQIVFIMERATDDDINSYEASTGTAVLSFEELAAISDAENGRN